jgi:hypothetical protein
MGNEIASYIGYRRNRNERGNAHPAPLEVKMYGLDRTVSISFLVERKVEQICVGEFQSQIRFDEDVVISVEGDVTIDGQRYGGPRASAGSLLALLGTRISGAKNPGNGDIELTMANGCALTVHDSEREHESYSVTWQGGTLVV